MRSKFRFNKKSKVLKSDPQNDKWYRIIVNRRRTIIRTILVFSLVFSSVLGSFLVASYLGKDVSIHLYTDLSVDDYEEISLITERDGYEYKLPLELDDKESYFKIPKTSTLEEFEIRKSTLVSEDYSEVILSNYSHDETIQINQSESNVKYIEGVPYNNYDAFNYSVPTDHYDGVNGFYYDEIGEEPFNFDVDYGDAYIQDEYLGHKKVLVLEKKTQINQIFSNLENGTFESWIQVRPKQDVEIQFYEDNDLVLKIRTFSTPNYVYYYKGSHWKQSGKLNNLNKLSPSEWANLRIDFRSDGASEYLGISEGRYDIYVNDIKVFDDLEFLRYSEKINKIVIKSLGCKDNIYFDSISFTGQNKEINNNTYNIGDKDLRLNAIEKQLFRSFKFNNTNYQNLKNATLSMIFKTNITLESDKDSGLKAYNFLYDQWEFLEIFSSNKTYFIDLSVHYFNDSKTTDTDTHFILFLSNLIFDYDVYFSINCSGYFWKEITDFSYKETYSFKGELSVDIVTTSVYKEKEIIVTSIIEVSYFFCFGSWKLENSTTISYQITIREQLYRIELEDKVSLSDDTFYGWRIVEVEIVNIDLVSKEVEADIEVGDFYV